MHTVSQINGFAGSVALIGMNSLTLRAGISTDEARLASGGWSSLPGENRPAGFVLTETASQPILARIAEQNATYFDEDLAKLENKVSAQRQIMQLEQKGAKPHQTLNKS